MKSKISFTFGSGFEMSGTQLEQLCTWMCKCMYICVIWTVTATLAYGRNCFLRFEDGLLDLLARDGFHLTHLN